MNFLESGEMEYIYIAVMTTTSLSGESFSILKARKNRAQLEQELTEEYGSPRFLFNQKEWRNAKGQVTETVVVKELICK